MVADGDISNGARQEPRRAGSTPPRAGVYFLLCFQPDTANRSMIVDVQDIESLIRRDSLRLLGLAA